jgi:hypothetical protein
MDYYILLPSTYLIWGRDIGYQDGSPDMKMVYIIQFLPIFWEKDQDPI